MTFRLAGINNQNFLMRDDQTGTWWQQVTGLALHGPLAGERLRRVPHDEVTFATWKRERPGGRVLKPDAAFESRYEKPDWEKAYAGYPVVTPAGHDEPLPPRALVMGVELNGQSKAYPFEEVARQSPILDVVGETPILIVVAGDGLSARVFEAALDGVPLEFFRKADAAEPVLLDGQTFSEWDFTGEAVTGGFAGRRLRRVPHLKEYWFDWRTYHPGTAIYRLRAEEVAPPPRRGPAKPLPDPFAPRGAGPG